MEIADEMFRELDYEKKEEQSMVKYISNYGGKTIWFDKIRKEFGSNINELQAINKKCEELNFKIF